MPTLEDKFRQFKDNLALPAGVKELISNLLEKLSTSLAGTVGQPTKIGSYARKTALAPINDVDLMIVLNESGFYGGQTPLQVLQKLQAILGHLKRPCRVQEHSVGVDYEGYRIDFVPALPHDGTYLIPEVSPAGGNGRWIRTNPKVHNDFTGRRDQELGAMGIPIVKMLKIWKKNRQLSIKSFHLEMMALQGLTHPPRGYAEGVRLAFTAAARLLRDGCPDPGLPSEKLGLDLGAQKRSDLSNACQNAAQTMAQAIQEDEHGGSANAVQIARSLFGSPFPT